ncbi:TM0106 family RecB-like putative nuclease [Qipengyuania sp. 1NDW9]|uniref:TM0106 family RecB-like putative nuclease n=1 Tax=Qipengyuania xiapuensis TaxID=2867236 RepID=UPI001C88C7B7|nr:TM0106 family RecB-like putative nuclease [Qipengyuania xiapuensis]MBX7492060.1 TM0106 family RecB-like putative nuclease [Qipengyuania xiapuensis]
MRLYEGELLHSASDLNTFMGCRHAVALNRQKLLDPASLPDKAADDESAVLVQDAGHEHEAQYLRSLNAIGEVAEISSKQSLEAQQSETIAAMHDGVPVIYQGTFFEQPWHGFTDFLRRVDVPSELGSWSYEVVDTKLARTPSPKHLLQLALYSELVGRVQGKTPHEMHLVLGSGEEASFRSVEFEHTLRVARGRYLGFIDTEVLATRPEPCSACSLCGWRDLCAEQWKSEDHLSQVAGMQSSQITKLRDAGISTVEALAALPPDSRIPKLAAATFERLRAQAILQVERRNGEPKFERLDLEPGRGFLRMPRPSPHDLFFDLEGDPLYPDGLEYLWGVHFRDDAGTPQFRFEWAHNRDEEREAFERMVDWFVDHVKLHPEAHIYHYAPYEVTVLRRLSTAFASREAEVDFLLRGEKFVDLYAIARSAIRTSEPDLSLKTLETFFAETRLDDVKKADQSIVHYHRWRETGDQVLLDGIWAYNKVDCENTEGLRDWLASIRPELKWWEKSGPEPKPEKTEKALEHEARLEQLREAIRKDDVPLSEKAKELAGHLLDFHKRSQKPDQWAIFDRCERDIDELIDDGECIGGLEPAGNDWLVDDKRSQIATYRFPTQDTKLREGKDVLHAPTQQRLGKIVSYDEEQGLVSVRRGKAAGEFPQSGSAIPTWPIDTSILESAVERVVRAWSATGPSGDLPYKALASILERQAPQFGKGTDVDAPGRALLKGGEDLVTGTSRLVSSLDHSFLFVQGPPGTGKTHTSAHVILDLLRSGKKVGVSSNSHKAINNLLGKVEALAAKQGVGIHGCKKASSSDPDSLLNGDMIVDVFDNAAVEDGDYNLVGGTAWLFARDALDQRFDYLFIDEAGQVSLGHLLAMGAAAKNIVLVGDQMQLAQPIKGAHPGKSGESALDYLLQGDATIAPERGVLLDTSWRMHPEITQFISAAVYDGRLTSHPDCAVQNLHLTGDIAGELPPRGIRMANVEHFGCRQQSDEEVAEVVRLVQSLLGQSFTDRRAQSGKLSLENILIVSPFNMQVNALRSALPEGARVGTVDKFQGQEAEVVIVSMATSSPEDLPRNVDFFYSKNRLNVAISRARTLAIVLANSRLLELEAGTVEHLRLVNTLAWLQSASSD